MGMQFPDVVLDRAKLGRIITARTPDEEGTLAWLPEEFVKPG